jgi:FkbM family methyltransferase
MLQWLQPKAGEVFVDIGAHLGKHAIAVSKLVGNEGQVIAMEAIPANFTLLKKNIELNKLKNIVSFNLAAWNCRCILKFFEGSTSANANINRYDYGFGCTDVQAERPDKLLLNNIGLKRVDWIKIDVEGAEYEVLLGLEETLSRFKPTLFVEVWSQNMSKVKAFLKKHNYRVDRISEFGEAQSRYYLEALFVPN